MWKKVINIGEKINSHLILLFGRNPAAQLSFILGAGGKTTTTVYYYEPLCSAHITSNFWILENSMISVL